MKFKEFLLSEYIRGRGRLSSGGNWTFPDLSMGYYSIGGPTTFSQWAQTYMLDPNEAQEWRVLEALASICEQIVSLIDEGRQQDVEERFGQGVYYEGTPENGGKIYNVSLHSLMSRSISGYIGYGKLNAAAIMQLQRMGILVPHQDNPDIVDIDAQKLYNKMQEKLSGRNITMGLTGLADRLASAALSGGQIDRTTGTTL